MDPLRSVVVDREIRAALALAGVERLGPRGIHELLGVHGTFAGILRGARAGDPRIHERVGPKLAAAVRRLRPVPARRLSELEDAGIRVLARGLPGYPPGLLHLHDPPPILYLRGRNLPLGGPAVAVVGTRRATEYGRRAARDLAAGLAEAELCVISGVARGIDARAHEGSLDVGGETVGVLGSGLNHRYPAANRRLYDRMEESGLLVSEFPPDQSPRPGFFPRRNRIIAALARAVVVVQAGRRSGALNTAGHALDLGREVLAVPGPVGLPASLGVHALLRDGAGLATRAADVLEAIGWGSAGSVSGPTDRREGAGRDVSLWAAARISLTDGPRTAEELSAATGLAVPDLLARLTRWEMDGRIETVGVGRYAAVR